MQQTSLLAYQQLNQLLRNHTYQGILKILESEPRTDREIAACLGYADPNKVRPRRNELVKMTLVSCGKKRICKISGKQALTWQINQSVSSNIDNRVIYPLGMEWKKNKNDNNNVYSTR